MNSSSEVSPVVHKRVLDTSATESVTTTSHYKSRQTYGLLRGPICKALGNARLEPVAIESELAGEDMECAGTWVRGRKADEVKGRRA